MLRLVRCAPLRLWVLLLVSSLTTAASAATQGIDAGPRVAASTRAKALMPAKFAAVDVRGFAVLSNDNPNAAGAVWHLVFQLNGGGTVTAGIGSSADSSYSSISWTVTDANIVVTPTNKLADRSESFEWDPGCQCQVLVTWDAVTDRVTLVPDAGRTHGVIIRTLAGVANSSRPDLVPNGSAETDALGTLVFRDDLPGYAPAGLTNNVLQMPVFDRQVGFSDRFLVESTDRFTFFTTGRGVTEREALSFGWRIVNTRELELTFSNGDVGHYFRSGPGRDTNTFEVSARFDTPEGRKFVISGGENRDSPNLVFRAAIIPGRWHAFGIGTEGRLAGVVDEFQIELRADGTGDQVSVYEDEFGALQESRNPIHRWSLRNGVITQLRTMSRSTFQRNCALSETDCRIVFRRTWTPSYRTGDRWYVIETIQFVNNVVTENLDDMPVNYRPRMYEFTALP